MTGRRAARARDPSRRRRILDAAKQQFTRGGFRGTNLEVVASRAGCAKGALYLEFPNKQALLRAVVDETFAAIHERFAAEVLSIDSPLERLVETLRFAFRQMAREPIFSRLMQEDPELDMLGFGGNPDAARAARAQIDEILEWVDEGIARGEIRPDVDRDAVPYVLGVLRFAPQHVAMIATLELFPAPRVLDAVAETFRAGLARVDTKQAARDRRRRKR